MTESPQAIVSQMLSRRFAAGMVVGFTMALALLASLVWLNPLHPVSTQILNWILDVTGINVVPEQLGSTLTK